jgi:hypothetical protein
MRNAYRIFAGEPEGKKKKKMLLKRYRRKREGKKLSI